MRREADPVQLAKRQLGASTRAAALSAHEVTLLRVEVTRLKKMVRRARADLPAVGAGLVLDYGRWVPGERSAPLRRGWD